MKLSGVRTCCAAALASLAPMAACRVPAWADSCGDRAGPGEARVACACGDTVITDTALKPGDPVVNALCSDVGLSIGVDHVTLNCNGRGFAGTTGQGIVLSGRTGVVVRSCRVTGFASGILLERSTGNTLLDNELLESQNGIEILISHDNLVKANVVTPTVEAIRVAAARANAIVGNTLNGEVNSAGNGIVFGGGVTDNTIKGNQVFGFLESGIDLAFGGGNAVLANSFSGNGTGITVLSSDPNTIARNTLSDNVGTGLLVEGNHHVLDGNRALRNGSRGISVAGRDNTVTRNTADDNQRDGIAIFGNTNLIDGNRGTSNGRDGLSVEGIGIPGTGNTVTGNVFDSNGRTGIFVRSNGGSVVGNRGRSNQEGGLLVDGTGNTVAGNTFAGNGEVNICVAAGNTDGGGNRVPPIIFRCAFLRGFSRRAAWPSLRSVAARWPARAAQGKAAPGRPPPRSSLDVAGRRIVARVDRGG